MSSITELPPSYNNLTSYHLSLGILVNQDLLNRVRLIEKGVFDPKYWETLQGHKLAKYHESALEKLKDIAVIKRVYVVIESDPVGGPVQGLFLNAAVKIETALAPRELLNQIHVIVAALGRVRDVKNGPRTIDIDILLYDDLQVNETDLIIPHPRMQERDFVMIPLREIF